MKKSVMLGKIWEVLYKNTDIYEEDLKLIAEDILNVIEENGMLPPVLSQYNAVRISPTGNEDHYKENVYGWEEE